MKIFKGITFKQVVDTSGIEIGETIVTRSEENRDQFQVHVQRIKGFFTPVGKFVNLKTAIHFAQRMDNPTMIKHGYEIIELDHTQKMVVYYQQIEKDVIDLCISTDYELGETLNCGQSGINVGFMKSKETSIEQTTKLIRHGEMMYFGQYLLSEERRKLFASHPEFQGDDNLIEERLKEVHDTDIGHWETWRRNNSDHTPLKMDSDENVVPDCRHLSPEKSKEMQIAHAFKKMCIESLEPQSFERFDKAFDELLQTRKLVKSN